MAERKKVQKINPKQSPKKAEPKKQAAPKKQPAKPAGKPKKAVPAKRAKPATEKIVMKAQNETAVTQKHSTRPLPAKEQKTKQRPKNTQNINRTEAPRKNTRSAQDLFYVILGKRAEVRKKRLITAVITFVVVMSIVIFWATSPTGPIERITNSITLIGGGEFPASVLGSKTLAFKNINEKSFVLSNSHIAGYNSSGKQFLSFQHNFSNPVLKTSRERILLYNRESNGFIVANNTNILFEESLQNPIYCADIGYNGSMAFVTSAPSYAAQVLVFNRSMKQYYSWYLADGLITDIALSNNGNYVAVSVLKVKNGVFTSEIYCLDTDEEQPVFVKEITDESIIELEVILSGKFMYSSNEATAVVEWDSGETVKVGSTTLSPAFFKSTSDGVLAVYSEAALSQVYLFNKKGEAEVSFEFNGLIDDISVYDEVFCVLSGNQITFLDATGASQGAVTLNQKPSFISAVNDGVLAVDNLHISHYSAVNK